MRRAYKTAGRVCGAGGGTRIGALLKPFLSDALFWLDGSISGNEFVDVSGNGRNFTISNNDIELSKGLPYKSAATISAPVGDATLIAADINNFLYDSGGTPNEIPVISLFQDVDYEHKLFCRHIAQKVDGDGVETYEPRIYDIVLYNTIKANNDLVKCQNYFSVDTEDVTAYWVMPTGNDTTGDGSKSNPWLTIDKSISVVNDSSLIYAKTNNNYNGGINGYINDSNINVINGIGRCRSVATSTYGLRANTGVIEISGLVIEPTGSQTALVVGVGTSCIFSRLYLNGSASQGIYRSFSQIKNTVIKGVLAGASIRNDNIESAHSVIDTVFDKSSATYFYYCDNAETLDVIIKNCKLVGDYTTSVFKFDKVAGETTVMGCYVKATGAKNIFSSPANTSGINSFLNNIVHITTDNDEAIVLISNAITNNNYIDNNRFIEMTASSAYIVQAGDSNVTVNGNYVSNLIAEKTIYAEFISFSTNSIVRNFTAIGNKVLTKRTAGYHIRAGAEETGAGDNSILAEVSENFIKSGSVYLNDYTKTVHGVFIGFQKNAYVRHNFVWGAGYGTVIKGSIGTAYDSGFVGYNIFKDCRYGIYSKGVSNVKFYNNTVIFKNAIPNYGVQLADNTGGDDAGNCEVKNNIIISLKSGTFYAIIATSGTNTIDYNIYYCPNGTLTFKVGGIDKTFSEWQDLGYDTHSVVLTDEQYSALFTDPDNNDFSLKSGAIAIGNGVNLGVDYDDGLNSTTDWGSDSEIPTVVTKQQGANWDIGAYVS